MKKIVFFLLAIVMIISLAACGKNETEFELKSVEEEYIRQSENKLLVINNKRNKVEIISKKNSKAATEITNYLSRANDNEWKEATDETDYLVESVNLNEIDLTEPVDDFGVTLKTTKAFENNKYITFYIERDGTMGGVSWYALKQFSFDKKTRRIVRSCTYNYRCGCI